MFGNGLQANKGGYHRGHLSPVLCAAAVSVQEAIWIKAYDVQLHSAFLCIRYVDNRLTVLPRQLSSESCYNCFLDLNFYAHPVELENCGDMKFLGYEINLQAGTMEFVVPSEPFAFRSTRSAGTVHRILSGLTARFHLIHRGSFPKNLVRPSVQKLLRGYALQGFDQKLLSQIAFKVSSKYKYKYRQ